MLGNERASEGLNVITLEKPRGFIHKPGQFIIIHMELGGKPVRRSYTVASAPHEDCIRLLIREQQGGLMSPVLCSSKKGDRINLLGPFGRFVLPPEGPLVLIGAGTGIAPFISFIKHMEHQSDRRAVKLIYSARTPEDLVFMDYLLDVSNVLRLDTNFTVTRPHLSSTKWDGRTGRIDDTLLSGVCSNPEASFLICGPTSIVGAVKAMLAKMGVPGSRVMTEAYGKVEA